MFQATLKLNDGSSEIVQVYDWASAPLPALELQPLGKGRNDKQQRVRYLDAVITLDTETSKVTHFEDGIEVPDGCLIYQWAMKLEDVYIAGRQADEIIWLLKRLQQHYATDSTHRLVIWVHNLAYDMSYLINALYAEFENVNLFAIGSNKPIKCTLDRQIELRCSWKLAGRSLAAWCQDVQPRHSKQVGEIDYNIVRSPDTPLSAADWDYMLNDVASQYDCLRDALKGEKLATIPMTSTGYVRRAMRKAAEQDNKWRRKYRDIMLTAEQYKLVKRAFTGGYCHANSWELGIHHNITSYDAASMYPAVQATELYPMTKFNWEDIDDMAELDDMSQDQEQAFICTIFFKNLRLCDVLDWDICIDPKGHKAIKLTYDQGDTHIWNPYINYNKEKLSVPVSDCVLDNGKVIFAEYATISMCDIDFKWIRAQYDFDEYQIINCMTAAKGPLPDWFKNELLSLYRIKTMLKGVTDGTDIPGYERFSAADIARVYQDKKGQFNAVYGMSATDIIHDTYTYNPDDCQWHSKDNHESIDSIQSAINKLMAPWSHECLPYQWGLYTTAQARDRLFTVMGCCKGLYCDTDSCKGYDWDLKKLARINKAIEKKSRAAGFVAKDIKGRERVIGVFELDGEYTRFSALHAKCYAYEYLDKKGRTQLHATIAGVTSSNGQPEFLGGQKNPRYITKEQELGKLENLYDGRIFSACGGTRSEYIAQPHTVWIDGKAYKSYGGCCIMNTTYEIGGTCNLVEKFFMLSH